MFPLFRTSVLRVSVWARAKKRCAFAAISESRSLTHSCARVLVEQSVHACLFVWLSSFALSVAYPYLSCSFPSPPPASFHSTLTSSSPLSITCRRRNREARVGAHHHPAQSQGVTWASCLKKKNHFTMFYHKSNYFIVQSFRIGWSKDVESKYMEVQVLPLTAHCSLFQLFHRNLRRLLCLNLDYDTFSFWFTPWWGIKCIQTNERMWRSKQTWCFMWCRFASLSHFMSNSSPWANKTQRHSCLFQLSEQK